VGRATIQDHTWTNTHWFNHFLHGFIKELQNENTKQDPKYALA
jgi:hypothetical protein